MYHSAVDGVRRTQRRGTRGFSDICFPCGSSAIRSSIPSISLVSWRSSGYPSGYVVRVGQSMIYLSLKELQLWMALSVAAVAVRSRRLTPR